jgi:hypothetical protein
MGKRKRNRQNGNTDPMARRPRDIPEYFRMLLERIVTGESDFIVTPLNPPSFGFQRPELLYKSPLVTGQVLFDDPFYNVIPPPPYGENDPTYPEWLDMLAAAEKRVEICQPGKESPACTRAREASFDAARAYATALDRVYGLGRYQDEEEQKKGNGSSSAAAAAQVTSDASMYAALMEQANAAHAKIIRIRRKKTRT